MIAFCFLFEKNRGSEFQVGYDLVSFPNEGRMAILTSRFQFSAYESVARKINGIEFKVIDGTKILFTLDNLAQEPKSAAGYRLNYAIWLLNAFFKIRSLRENRILWFVNLVQVASPNLFYLIRRQNIIAGPLGGQSKFYDYKFLPFGLRIKNFILWKLIYKISPIQFAEKASVYLISEYLGYAFRSLNYKVLPAITFPEKINNAIASDRKNNSIILYYRDATVKLGLLALEVSQELKLRNAVSDVIVVGNVPLILRERYSMLSFLGHVSQDTLSGLFQQSTLHLFLSLELAGLVQFEALANGCPNFRLRLSNQDKQKGLIQVGEDFEVVVKQRQDRESVKALLIEKITHVLASGTDLSEEVAFQLKSCKQYNKLEKDRVILDAMSRMVQ